MAGPCPKIINVADEAPAAGAHIVMLSSHIPNDSFNSGSEQYQWFLKDLQALDRTKTPSGRLSQAGSS